MISFSLGYAKGNSEPKPHYAGTSHSLSLDGIKTLPKEIQVPNSTMKLVKTNQSDRQHRYYKFYSLNDGNNPTGKTVVIWPNQKKYLERHPEAPLIRSIAVHDTDRMSRSLGPYHPFWKPMREGSELVVAPNHTREGAPTSAWIIDKQTGGLGVAPNGSVRPYPTHELEAAQ